MIITKRHLQLFKPERLILESERLNYLWPTKEERESKGATIFLSHKHEEIEILRQVVSLLKSLGTTIYLDWLDEDMPTETSGKTAERLKNKIIENQKFILLATEAAIASKWCNWELGYGDAKKFEKHIAIMPIEENDGTWSGNEYLQIYPTIKNRYKNLPFDYYIESKNQEVSLLDWLKS